MGPETTIRTRRPTGSRFHSERVYIWDLCDELFDNAVIYFTTLFFKSLITNQISTRTARCSYIRSLTNPHRAANVPPNRHPIHTQTIEHDAHLNHTPPPRTPPRPPHLLPPYRHHHDRCHLLIEQQQQQQQTPPPPSPHNAHLWLDHLQLRRVLLQQRPIDRRPASRRQRQCSPCPRKSTAVIIDDGLNEPEPRAGRTDFA